jgi:hypothetical protein
MMERSPVSFATFESVTLQNSSVWALVNLVKDYSTNSGVRAKLSVSWMILALTYVLGFPTLMSAMTGYSGTSWQLPRPNGLPQPKATNCGSVPATSQPYIQTPDGSQVQWSSFRLANYIIHDGWRVGLTGDYIVKAVSRDELCMVASLFYIHCSAPSICSMALTDFQADPSTYWDSNFCINGDPEYYTSSPLPLYQQLTKKCLLTLAVTQCKVYPCRFRTTLSTIQLIQTSFLKVVGLSKDSSSSVAAQCCHC